MFKLNVVGVNAVAPLFTDGLNDVGPLMGNHVIVILFLRDVLVAEITGTLRIKKN